MRWIWTFAIACIIAASGVPQPSRRDDPDAGALQQATRSLPHVALRTQLPSGHDWRPPAALVPVRPHEPLPPAGRVVAESRSFVFAAARAIPARCARGPPIG